MLGTKVGEISDCKICRGLNYILGEKKNKKSDDVMTAQLCDCFHCDICGRVDGFGFIFTEDEFNRESITKCDCNIFNERLKYFTAANIPLKFKDKEFDTFIPISPSNQGEILKRCRDFVDEFGKPRQKGIILMGSTGVGKTHLAVSVIKKLIMDKGVACKFVDFFELLRQIREGYSNNISEDTILRPYTQARVLVIDEFAKCRSTDWEQTMLDQIISIRYNADINPTILTTNYLDKAPEGGNKKTSHVEFGKFNTRQAGFDETLEEKVGPRVYSRLMEMCSFLKVEGHDFRTERYR